MDALATQHAWKRPAADRRARTELVPVERRAHLELVVDNTAVVGPDAASAGWGAVSPPPAGKRGRRVSTDVLGLLLGTTSPTVASLTASSSLASSSSSSKG